jgi:hypothetical protein
MHQVVTITQLSQTATVWIESEAARTGLAVEDIVRQLIYRGLEVERQKNRRQRFSDLDGLAGTWSEKDAAEFNDAIADLSQIEPALWP